MTEDNCKQYTTEELDIILSSMDEIRGDAIEDLIL